MHKPHYIKGQHWMVCDICGFDYRVSQMRQEWDGAWACNGPGTNQCWSPKHPQLFVRSKADRQSVPNPRPPQHSFTIPEYGVLVDGVPGGAPTTDQGTI